MISGRAPDSRVVAVLGPTNTGKTHFAVERMLAHRSGMIGFPLRLLAREIYDRVVAIKGVRAAALVTGEEKIYPRDARYLIATVEAMPLEVDVEFLAVDEVQLASDPARGHIFTDRLLNARGRAETMFMGSLTAERQLKRLIPKFELITRPRFSTLSYSGTCKISRLPQRGAVVAFSANDVYTLAELVRRQHGGAAVVLGALSPRTRNAQVEMYQSGEVDHLVATDAIGMGLNMDLGHVTFARTVKFDGRHLRPLHAPEVAQIAGRAGRHMANGTFGVAKGADAFDPRLIESVENHAFSPLRTFRWRNGDLDFANIERLKESLDARPPHESLIKVRDALDDRCLALLAAKEDIRKRATGAASVRLLWQVCQIPDFRQSLTGAHLQILNTVFDQIVDRGRLDGDWVGSMIDRLERTDGEIDALVNRIAHIRTWTYLSHRDQWFDDPAHWQARARSIEDRLSDALHERLTQRFVDRRTAALMRSVRERGDVMPSIDKNHGIMIDGHAVGKLDGLHLTVESGGGLTDDAMLLTAVRNVAKRSLIARGVAIFDADDDAFSLDAFDRIIWQDAVIGQLTPTAVLLRPSIRISADDAIPSNIINRLEQRLEQWRDRWLGRVAAPLLAIQRALNAEQISAAERSLLFRLEEMMGSARRKGLGPYLSKLDDSARARLTAHGVRFGRHYLHLEGMLKPAAVETRIRLLRIAGNLPGDVARPGTSVLRGTGNWSDDQVCMIGYHRFGEFALRQDMFERLAAGLRARGKDPLGFSLPIELAPDLGLTRDELQTAILATGYRRVEHAEAANTFVLPPKKPRKRPRKKPKNPRSTDSPFAALKNLKFAP